MGVDRVTIVGIGGSMVQPSTSLAALRIALEGAAEAGAEIELYDVRQMNLPMYLPGQPPTEDALRLVEASRRCHGMLWSSPLYQGSISGAFKNALDWLDLLREEDPPFLTDRVIGLITTAGGSQGLQGVNTMEFIVRAMRGWAVPLVMPIAQAWKEFDDHGQPRDVRLAEHLRKLGSEVARASRQMVDEGQCDYSIDQVDMRRI